jgi:hypothetical protein
MTTENHIDKMQKVAALTSGVNHVREHLEVSIGRCSLWAGLNDEGKLKFLLAAVSLFVLEELDASYDEAVVLYKRELRRQVKVLDQAEEMANDPSEQWDGRR